MSSVEVLNAYNSKFCLFFSYLYIWYEINNLVKFFLYIHVYIIAMYHYFFLDFGWGNNTNTDKAERGTLTM